MILLLDVMGTIVRDPFHDMPSFFGMTMDQLLAEKHPDAWIRLEKDEIDPAEFLRSFFADGRSFDHDAFVSNVKKGYRYLPGMEGLLADLQTRGTTMHALSNYPRWSDWIEERLTLTRFVPWTFVSWKTGIRKPDAEAYLGAARVLNVAPAQCLFVDDRESNVRAAREVGMDAVRFEGSDALRGALEARGLL